jgi:hypothetical protein
MSIAKTAVTYLNNLIASTIYEQASTFTAVGLANDGSYIPDLTTTYISSATTVKGALSTLDGNLSRIANDYATIAYTDQQFSTIVNGSPSTLDTLYEIAAAIENNSSFSVSVVSSISGESTRAQNSESTITGDLNTEIARAGASESTILTNLNIQTASAVAAEQNLSTMLSGETARANGVEGEILSSIQGQIAERTTLLGNLNSYISSYVSDLTVNLTSMISTEVIRASTAEEALTSTLNAEVLRATTSQSTIQANLTAEYLRALAAENNISTLIVNETSRALGAESTISGHVSTVEINYINKDGSVAFTNDMNAGNNKIINVGTPVSDNDLANKSYVDSKINSLGSVFEYVTTVNIATTNDLTTLTQKSAGDVYKIVGNGNVITQNDGSISTVKYVKDGDFVVRNSAENDFDILNNKDISVAGTSGRVTVTGNGFDDFSVDIASNYVGQNSINTVGTVTTGTWEASTISSAYGGLGFSNYATGDLLLGTSGGTLNKLSVGSANTMLKSDGTNASWVPGTTANFAITDTTNFGGLSTVQQAIDSIYNKYTLRNIIQHVVNFSPSYSNPTSYNPDLLTGKVNFINISSGVTSVFLPASDVVVPDATIIRIVHNNEYDSPNLGVYYRDVAASSNVNITEIGPRDTMAFIWNSNTSEWMVGIGL